MSRKNRWIQQSLLLLILGLFCEAPVFGQETREWEFFGGYSFKKGEVREYFRSTPIIYSPRNVDAGMYGWNVSITENMNRRVGGTLDISGHLDRRVAAGVTNRERMYAIMYGPRIAYPQRWGTPFVHALFGIAHADVRVTPVGPHADDFAFAAAAGGGLDIKIRNHIAIRAFQIEYFRAEPLGTSPHGYRAAVGVVFTAGKRR